jgi:hypothetical protein
MPDACIPCGCGGNVIVEARFKTLYNGRSLCYAAEDGGTYYGKLVFTTPRQIKAAETRVVIDECSVTQTFEVDAEYCDSGATGEPPPCCNESESTDEPCGEDLQPCSSALIQNDCYSDGETEISFENARTSPPPAPALEVQTDWSAWAVLATITAGDFRAMTQPAPNTPGPASGIPAASRGTTPTSHEIGQTICELRLKPGSRRVPVLARFNQIETPEGGSPSNSTADVLIPVAAGATVLFEPAIPAGDGDLIVDSIDVYVPGEV